MSTEFYERDGALRVKMDAGGSGGGLTSQIDLPATADLIAAHPREHGGFLAAKAAAAAQAQVVPDLTSELASAHQKIEELTAELATARTPATEAHT